eukprot:m.30880 g.30880  ORF g.30880 m.30880 type:complete len:141 (+) comp8253_c0_seq1:139-561(+)
MNVKNVLAVIGGMAGGMAVNMGIITLTSSIYPPADDKMDFSDQDQLVAYIKTLPATAFVMVMVAHLGQSFVGGYIAARFGSSSQRNLALTCGVLTLAGGIYNMMVIPHPMWMKLEIPLYILTAKWGADLALGGVDISKVD